MILPQRLIPGSRLKVIFPAGPLKGSRNRVRYYNDGISLLEAHFAIEGSRLLEREADGFAGSDEQRADELNQAWRSDRIHALIAGRGGYGCLRILNALDFDAAARSPKALIGFSDITILQAALYQKLQLISFSGPMPINLDSAALSRLLPLLTQPTTGIDLIPEKSKVRIEVLSDGEAEGVLLGGNLFSLVQLIGTGFLPRLNDAIFFFEDINETVDHIDSFLHHLKLAGLLYGVKGVIVGDISWRETEAKLSARKTNALICDRLRTIFRKEIPILFGVPFGHIDKSITIPYGARARLDTKSRSLTLLQEVTAG